MINEILKASRNNKCSDIHISANTGIKVRQDGLLADYPIEFPQNELIKMIMELIPKRLIDNVDRHEDADFVYHVGEERYRVNIYYEQTNICAAIRVINDEILTLEQLEMPTVLNQIAMEPRGLVLVTGPTGSGKSTTLAAMIDLVNKQRNCHILTIEDPIEYLHTHNRSIVSQREVYHDTRDYISALKAALREAPEVILVGEMRDLETIDIAVTAAETGHLLFSSLHTIGAANTIDRMIDVFPSSQQQQIRVQLAMVLSAVISQQLVPSIDGKMIPVFEIMICNQAIRTLIREGKTHQIDNAIATNRNQNMITMDDSLLELYKHKQITKEVALMYATNPTFLINKL